VREANIAELNEAIKKNELEKQMYEDTAKLSLLAKYNHLKTTAQSLDIVIKAQKASQEGLNQATIQYKTGTMSVYDLVNAQKSFLDCQIQLANTRSDLDLSWLQYQAELGSRPTTHKGPHQ
ncbi:MAG: TolC family protein, partial [Silvanigrellaceae bacterium]|nr:TolC family protein [Silvanigrellaceae bacterium]